MNKFSKILALGLAGASVLTGGFILSGCEKSDKNSTQLEQNMDIEKGVIAISFKKNSSPKYIIRGKFSRANIKMLVTYDNYITKEIEVTESMLDEHSQQEVKQAGQYNLTIKFGGQTATMYANVVDERYLLKEVVEKYINKDVTISTDSSIMQIDMDNKITIHNGYGYSFYSWIKDGVRYDYEDDDGNTCYEKCLASDWEEQAKFSHTKDILNILETGRDQDGNYWKIESVKGDGVNYTLTAKRSVGSGFDVREYIFNEDFLSSIREYEEHEKEISGEQTFNYNYTPITLKIPDTVDTNSYMATVDYDDKVNKLDQIMSKYLEKDLEVYLYDSSIIQIDIDNQVMNSGDNKLSWMWVSGDYYYVYTSNEEGGYTIEKYSAAKWKEDLANYVFMRDSIYKDNVSKSIELVGDYYVITVQDEEIKYKYIFNNEEIKCIEINTNTNNEVRCYKNCKWDMTLPEGIKKLESEAQ